MAATEAKISGRLAPVWAESESIWLVITPDAQRMDPAGLVPDWLADRAVAQQHWSLGVNSLTFYARTADRAATLHHLAPDFELPTPLAMQIASGAELVGYRPPLSRYRTGDTASFTLYWHTPPDTAFDLHLAGPKRVVHAVEAPRPASHGFTPQLVSLPLTPDLPAGGYALQLPVRGDDTVTLATFTLFHPSSARSAVQTGEIQHPSEIRLGESIRFLGYTLDQEQVTPGESLDLTLYWQTSDVISERYKVFVHLLGETFNADTGNFLWGQHDSEPAKGTLPTTQWMPDTVIVDAHTVPVAPDAPSGRYTLQVGLYGLVDGARLNVLDAEGRPEGDVIVLTEIEVR
jgi:hypothetical protein